MANQQQKAYAIKRIEEVALNLRQKVRNRSRKEEEKLDTLKKSFIEKTLSEYVNKNLNVSLTSKKYDGGNDRYYSKERWEVSGYLGKGAKRCSLRLFIDNDEWEKMPYIVNDEIARKDINAAENGFMNEVNTEEQRLKDGIMLGDNADEFIDMIKDFVKLF